MPQVQESKPRTLCPPGTQTFVLAEVTEKMMPSFNGEGETLRWIWRFVGEQQDENGQFVEVAVFTGPTYGDPRAKLTWLLDLLMPNATAEEKRRLNTDSLIGAHYEGMVQHKPGITDPSQKFANFAYLKPAGETGPDPFIFDDAGSVQVCSECGVEVEASIARAALKRFGGVFCHPHGRAKMAADKAAKEASENPPAE